MTEAWAFRNGTLDEAIFHQVVRVNEYHLPDRFEPDDIVIDVGSHIGSFAQAVLSRGCRNLYCIEPDRSNFEIAAANLKPYVDRGCVQLIRGAAWRSDDNTDQLYFDGYHPFPKSFMGMQGIINTGNGSVIWGSGDPVAKIAFDDVVDLMTRHGKDEVRLLKLDCEGAEWPILKTSRRLHLIREICGEFHEIGGKYLEISEDRPVTTPVFASDQAERFTVDVLVGILEDAGFTVTFQRHHRSMGAIEGLGLFFARRGPARAPA